MKKAIFLILLSLSLISFKATANSFDILDFRFGINDPTFSSWQTTQGANNMDPSLYGTLSEDTYQGSNSTQALINFDFLGVPVHISTSATNFGPSGVFPPGGGTEFGSNTPAGSIPGGPAPTVDLIGLTADMSSWFAEWNGTDFNQGNNTNWFACSSNLAFDQLSSIATVTDNLDSTYRISWNSCITNGIFDGQIGFWQLDLECINCDVSAVPLPASIWLLGSALLGLIGMIRRKK